LIFAQDWHSPDSEEFEIWGQHCVRGTRGAEIIDEPSPFSKEAYVVKKNTRRGYYAKDIG
jgi:nicotinamidase-related amidase